MSILSKHDVLPDTWVKCPDCRMHARVGRAGEMLGGEPSRCGQCDRTYSQRDVEVAAQNGRRSIVQVFVGAASVKAQRWQLAATPRLLTDAE